MTENISQDLADQLIAQIGVYIESLVAQPEPDNVGGIKVGDRVRVLEDYAWYASVSKGDIFTVAELILNDSYNGPHVRVEGPEPWVFRPGVDIELAPEPAFAVGDRVLVTAKYSSEERIHFGTIARIDNECCGDDEYKVNFDDGDYDYYGESSLESLDEREPVRLTSREEPEVGEQLVFVEEYAGYKPGDLATVVFTKASAFGDAPLITVSTADGFGTSAFPTRFGRL